MNKLDWLVLSAVAAAAAWPAIVYGYKYVANALLSPAPKSTTPASLERWRQKWTATLISLLDSVEAGDAASPKAASLCRELMWEIIGGSNDEQPKSQGGKK